MIGQTYSNTHYNQYEKTGDKNIFEEVIDKMMIDEYLEEEFKEEINKFSSKDKRRAIFLLINEKSQFVFEEIKKINDNTSVRDRLKITIEAINKYIEVGQREVKKYGEVFTPLNLVDDMLDTLPDEVWSNPNLKWLDPANGIGNFPIRVIPRLMKGLSDWETDVDKRYKHIIENMLYTCDLQPRNMFTYLFLVDPLDEHITNIYTGSFLGEGFDRHMKDVWEVDKFDIVVGNPPYNGSPKSNISKTSGSILWDKFVGKSIDILNYNGYLSMIHPAIWRKPINKNTKTEKILEKFKKYNLMYLEIHDTRDGLKIFNAGTRYDFYCLKKSKEYENTTIKDESGQIINLNIRNVPFIPNKKIHKVVDLLGNDSIEVIFNSSYHSTRNYISKEKSENFKYPIVHSTPKKGTRFLYSSLNDKGHFNVPKVIFGESGINNVIIDDKGDYGMSQGAIGLILNENDNPSELKSALESSIFKDIIKSCIWSNFRIDSKLFMYFKKGWYKSFIEN